MEFSWGLSPELFLAAPAAKAWRMRLTGSMPFAAKRRSPTMRRSGKCVITRFGKTPGARKPSLQTDLKRWHCRWAKVFVRTNTIRRANRRRFPVRAESVSGGCRFSRRSNRARIWSRLFYRRYPPVWMCEEGWKRSLQCRAIARTRVSTSAFASIKGTENGCCCAMTSCRSRMIRRMFPDRGGCCATASPTTPSGWIRATGCAWMWRGHVSILPRTPTQRAVRSGRKIPRSPSIGYLRRNPS